MGKHLGRNKIGENFRIYIPTEVKKILDLKEGNELTFELEKIGNKEYVVVWQNIINRDVLRKTKKLNLNP